MIFTLFVSLIVRLGYLQIVEGEEFNKNHCQFFTTNHDTIPRGQIYDSQGKVLVSNKANLAITYTRGKILKEKIFYRLRIKLTNLLTFQLIQT